MKVPSLPFELEFTRSDIILSLKIITISVVTFAVFYQDLVIVAVDALQSEFMSYILAVPFIFTYLVYRRRNMIKAAMLFESSESSRNVPHRSEIAGALLFVTCFFLYTGGSYTFTPLEYHMFVLPIFAAACTAIVFNLSTLRQLAFPIIFLLFLVPLPSDIVNILGSVLSEASSEYACAILNFFGFVANISIEAEFPVITVQTNETPLTFMVDPACSGLYSLFGFLIFAIFIAYIARGKGWKRVTTFLIGFPLIYLLNISRITIIVILGYYYGMGLAMNIFHLMGGWVLVLLGTFLLLLVSEKLLKIQLFAKKNIASCPQCNPAADSQQNFCRACGRLLKHMENSFKKRDLAKISAIVLSVILIISVQTPVFALTKGPADIVTQIANSQNPTTEVETVALKLLPQVDGYTLKYQGLDLIFMSRVQSDAALQYAYFPSNDSYTNTILVSIEIASGRSSLHRWDVCLVRNPLGLGKEPRVEPLSPTEEKLLVENPPIFATYFAFKWKKTDLTQVVLEWFESATFSTNSTSQQKHVKFSLIMYPDRTENLEEVEEQLQTLGVAIANYWQPLKLWSPTALLISQNGSRLAAIPTATLGLILGLNIVVMKRKKNANKRAYKKLPTQDQQVIEAIQRTQLKTISTTNNIKPTYRELSGKNMEMQELIQRLESMKKLGLVKEKIVSQQDEPTLIWKAEP